MSMTDPQLPRPLLALEALTLFLPGGLLWAWALAAAFNHMLTAGNALCLASAASIGPAGLAFFGQVILRISSRRQKHRSLALILLAGWSSVAILLLPSTPTPLKELPWRDCVLLTVLPLIGVAHYALLELRSHSLDPKNALQGSV